MSQNGERPAGRPQGTADVVLRAVVVVALVAGAGLALQARQGLDWSELADPVRVRWARVIAGVLALAVLAACARTLLRRLKRTGAPVPSSGDDGPPGERMPVWIRVLFVVLVLLTFLLVWYIVDGVTGMEPRVVEGLEQGPPPGEGSEAGPTTEGPSWPTLLMIAAVLAAVALVSRRRTLLRLTGSRDATVAAESTTVDSDAEDLSSAVTAAEAELARPGDARSAIVAAYAAMAAQLASGLARRGRPASDADTPTELLDRAAGSGLVDGAAAGTLTQLFREARFSRHPMGEPERRSAEQALVQVRDELERGVPDPFGFRDADDEPDEADEVGGRGRKVRAVIAIALVVTVVAVATAGPAGLLVALSAAAVATALILTVRLPAAPPPRARRRTGRPIDNAPFRSYRRVADQLSWASVSPRHYDMVTRPLLTQLAAARLADRHRVDLHADPSAARSILGEDVWPWIDPQRPASRNSQPPGVGPDTLTLIVDRLEHL